MVYCFHTTKYQFDLSMYCDARSWYMYSDFENIIEYRIIFVNNVDPDRRTQVDSGLNFVVRMCEKYHFS